MEPATFDRGVIAFLLSLLYVVWTGPALGSEQLSGGGAELAHDLRHNVVAIRAVWIDGSEHDGFGLMVGSEGDETYIVTADHVVRGIGPGAKPDAKAKKIKIELYDKRGQTFDAKLLGTREKSIDVAVITARLPGDVTWRKTVLASEPDALGYGDEVWFIGRDRSWYVPAKSGAVNRINRLHHRIVVDALAVRKGTSGAPLVADGGIVGMIVRDDAAESRATLIDAIETAFIDWGHPWDLSPLADKPPKENLEAPQEVQLEARAEFPLTREKRREVQRALHTLGHDPRGVDGIFGHNTRRAIRSWQNTIGADATGYLTEDQHAELLSQSRAIRAAEPAPRIELPRALRISQAEAQVRALFGAAARRDVDAYMAQVEVPFWDRGNMLTDKFEVRNVVRERMERADFPKYLALTEIDARFISDYIERKTDDEANSIAQLLRLEDDDVVVQVRFTSDRVEETRLTMFYRSKDGALNYAGSCCGKRDLEPALAERPPRTAADKADIFWIPVADIRIDGSFNDWREVRPVLIDPPNDEDSTANFPGTDLEGFYLARDEMYLYLAITLHDGMPRWDRNTLYFFVANQRPFQVDIPGDMDAAVGFSEEGWHVWTVERGVGGQPMREAIRYPSHFVANGSSFIEWKVPLEDMGDLNGRFVRVYIHVVGPKFENVSDGSLTGRELRIE